MATRPDGDPPAALPVTTELVIGNDLAQLPQLSAALERLGEAHGIATQPLYQLQVALDEMVSNVIRYAWPEGGSHLIHVRMTVATGRVTIQISDDGRPFDPHDAPAPAPPQPGQRSRPGGLGVHMVKQIVEQLDYTRADGRNCLTMSKTCAVGAPPQATQQGR
ncbi:MAG TPA: ATP-binding protein [Gammaproteobacteria bacterium]